MIIECNHIEVSRLLQSEDIQSEDIQSEDIQSVRYLIIQNTLITRKSQDFNQVRRTDSNTPYTVSELWICREKSADLSMTFEEVH